jgi:DNA-binding NarL/FixJ family response regulator
VSAASSPASSPASAGEPRLRVVVADDQAAVREGLVTLLGLLPDIEVVGAAADGEQAIALTVRHDPDVVLMDLTMPHIDGVTATARIRAEHPRTQVVVLTTFADDTNILAALRAGALGFLTKDAGRAQIARALHTAAAGQAVLDLAVHARLLARVSDPAPPASAATVPLPDGLTTREAEVLALIAEGLTNTQIAARLYVAETTIKTHINHIFTKARLHDRAQAVAYAHAHHLTGSPPG